ncbi:MAG: hypothetical protein ACI8P9_001715 [Parasphingorhabdus sp.]|jgi:hypothetical protein
MLGAKRIILCHHDNYLPGFSRRFGTQELTDYVHQKPNAEFIELDYSFGYEVFKNLPYMRFQPVSVFKNITAVYW